MAYTDINRARFYYEIAGQGETVTLLHAGIADRRMWDAQFEALAQDFRVLRYDLRGYGQTDADPIPFQHYADLAALLDTLDIERTALVGCSNGGRVALDFLLTYPRRVSALVMVCSAPGGFHFEGETPPLWNEVVQAFEYGDLEQTSALETEMWVVGAQRTSDQVDAGIRELVYQMNLIALTKETVIIDEVYLNPPAVERLDEVRVPTLIVVGDVDSPVTLEAGKLMAARIPGARQEVIANSAHLPNLEHPDEFNRTVLEFLEAATSS